MKPARLLLKSVQYLTSSQSHVEPEHYFDKGVFLWDDFVNTYQEELPAFLERWEMQRCHIGFRTARDLSYLQWRYGRQPNIKYWIYAHENNTGLDGFLIVRPYVRYGLQGVFLNEMFLREPSRDTGLHILKGFINHFKGNYIIAHFSDGTIERDILVRQRFFRIPVTGIVFTVKPLKDNILDPGNSNNWDMTLGDLEIF